MTVDYKLIEFFWARVVKIENGCWIWRGRITGRGYGTIKIGEHGKEIRAHRASWMIHTDKPIETGMIVCHKCDTSACVRPDHLFCGTQSDNIKDAINKKRFHQLGVHLPKNNLKTRCPHGHAYDAQNTGVSINPHGAKVRYCRMCHKLRARQQRELAK